MILVYMISTQACYTLTWTSDVYLNANVQFPRGPHGYEHLPVERVRPVQPSNTQNTPKPIGGGGVAVNNSKLADIARYYVS